MVEPPARVEIVHDNRAALIAWPGASPELRVLTDRARIAAGSLTVPVHYPEEAERGTAPDESLHEAVTISASLRRGASVTVVLGTDAGSRLPLPSPSDFASLTEARATRERALIDAAGPPAADGVVAALVLAADRFLVRRPDPSGTGPDDGVTVIAGYPWFGDWGRDTMISLPGLALATGRHVEARRILLTWAGLVRDGLLPNHFPDAGGGGPAYHAIDAPLWFIHALGAWERATGDETLTRDLRPAVEEIVTRFRDGTRFGIGVDPADGLVRGGAPGLQLTWMDAKVDGVVITPRHGKPVEIQALWIEALRLAAGWAHAAGDEGAARAHRAGAARAAASFRTRFYHADRGWLRDVVDGPDGDDASLRPNQLLALSLLDDLVDRGQAASVLDAVGRHLVVPGGVRTLAPFEPDYRPAYQGPPAFRDSAYHQGPAWTWLLGPWITAVAAHRGPQAARLELDTALAALDPGRTGAIPELLEPEPPHAGRGCPWQAWGVAELLRCAVDLAR
jgi:predicted glycogen debranching enzyme